MGKPFGSYSFFATSFMSLDHRLMEIGGENALRYLGVQPMVPGVGNAGDFRLSADFAHFHDATNCRILFLFILYVVTHNSLSTFLHFRISEKIWWLRICINN